MSEQQNRHLLKKLLVVLAGVLVLAGCVTTRGSLAVARKKSGTDQVGRNAFWHCSGHGCRDLKRVSLTGSQWDTIKKEFEDLDLNRSGAQEREAIRYAVASLEKIVGKQTGTEKDVAGSFLGFAKSGQMDCVDEMLNVASYLDLLIQEELVIKHRLGHRHTNHFFKTSAWPHTATSIVENETGDEFIVDAWFLDNGNLPYVVTLEKWSEGGWRNDDTVGDNRGIELDSE